MLFNDTAPLEQMYVKPNYFSGSPLQNFGLGLLGYKANGQQSTFGKIYSWVNPVQSLINNSIAQNLTSGTNTQGNIADNQDNIMAKLNIETSLLSAVPKAMKGDFSGITEPLKGIASLIGSGNSPNMKDDSSTIFTNGQFNYSPTTTATQKTYMNGMTAQTGRTSFGFKDGGETHGEIVGLINKVGKHDDILTLQDTPVPPKSVPLASTSIDAPKSIDALVNNYVGVKSTLNTTTFDGKLKYAYNFFLGKGFTPAASAGIVGNLAQESRLDSTAVNKDSGAYGIAQWLGDRKKNYFSRYGKNDNLDNQLNFLVDELNTSEKAAKQKIMEATNPADAAMAFANHYERMNPKEANYTNRISIAQKVMRGYKDGGDVSAPMPSFNTRSFSLAGKNVSYNAGDFGFKKMYSPFDSTEDYFMVDKEKAKNAGVDGLLNRISFGQGRYNERILDQESNLLFKGLMSDPKIKENKKKEMLGEFMFNELKTHPDLNPNPQPFMVAMKFEGGGEPTPSDIQRRIYAQKVALDKKIESENDNQKKQRLIDLRDKVDSMWKESMDKLSPFASKYLKQNYLSDITSRYNSLLGSNTDVLKEEKPISDVKSIMSDKSPARSNDNYYSGNDLKEITDDLKSHIENIGDNEPSKKYFQNLYNGINDGTLNIKKRSHNPFSKDFYRQNDGYDIESKDGKTYYLPKGLLGNYDWNGLYNNLPKDDKQKIANNGLTGEEIDAKNGAKLLQHIAPISPTKIAQQTTSTDPTTSNPIPLSTDPTVSEDVKAFQERYNQFAAEHGLGNKLATDGKIGKNTLEAMQIWNRANPNAPASVKAFSTYNPDNSVKGTRFDGFNFANKTFTGDNISPSGIKYNTDPINQYSSSNNSVTTLANEANDAAKSVKTTENQALLAKNELDNHDFKFGALNSNGELKNDFLKPQTSSNNDILGKGLNSLLSNGKDLAAAAYGFIGANKRTPTWQLPDSWLKYKAQSEQMANQGFSPLEKAAIDKRLNDSYDLGVSSIKNLSGGGGNQAAALSALSGLQGTRKQGDLEAALSDVAQRRQNFANYGNVVSKDLNLDRMLYGDEVARVQQQQQAGGTLLSSALQNMEDRKVDNLSADFTKKLSDYYQAKIDESKKLQQRIANRVFAPMPTYGLTNPYSLTNPSYSGIGVDPSVATTQ